MKNTCQLIFVAREPSLGTRRKKLEKFSWRNNQQVEEENMCMEFA
jgi:hypothetical protein